MYQQAQSYWSQYALAGYNGVFNWDTKTPGLPVLFAQIAQANPSFGGNMSTWQTEAERYFDGIVYGGGGGYSTRGPCVLCAGVHCADAEKAACCIIMAIRTTRALILRSMLPCCSGGTRKSPLRKTGNRTTLYVSRIHTTLTTP
eukprot:GHVR01011189.1.p1 GENE.GHVR01011189.1~~GHVR01011189.1.p1  ORF type:complete len:144 (+),score=12.06 GHVR01011189.1:1047-1478(+)